MADTNQNRIGYLKIGEEYKANLADDQELESHKKIVIEHETHAEGGKVLVETKELVVIQPMCKACVFGTGCTRICHCLSTTVGKCVAACLHTNLPTPATKTLMRHNRSIRSKERGERRVNVVEIKIGHTVTSHREETNMKSYDKVEDFKSEWNNLWHPEITPKELEAHNTAILKLLNSVKKNNSNQTINTEEVKQEAILMPSDLEI